MSILKGSKLSKEHREKISKSMKGGNSTSFKKGNKLSEITKTRISDYRKGKKLSDFSKNKCRLANLGKHKHFGESNPNWVKDRSKLKTGREKMYDTKYKYWTREVKKRDGWKCRLLNSECKGRLESHHILDWENNPELRYVVNNGITLCHAHHPRGRAKEKRLEPVLMELVSVSKE